MKETLLFFEQGGSDGKRGVFPARNFLGLDMASATSMQVSFAKYIGDGNASIIALTIQAGKAKEAAEVIAGALAGQNRGLITVGDGNNGNYLYPFTAITQIN